MRPIKRSMRPFCLWLFIPILCSGCGPWLADAGNRTPKLPLAGQTWVAALPHAGGLQYCAHLTPRSLAPPGSRDIHVHSLSAYITTTRKGNVAYTAIKGRYPGWDTPGTTIYNQAFSNTNTVWLEIIHEFPLGMACMEVYGHNLRPSTYAAFKNRILVSYTYQHKQLRANVVRFFPVTWGQYLAQFSPRHRPKH